MDLRVVDSLTGRPKTVRAARGGAVSLYVCGPTVYDAAHVGHGRTYLWFDVARRFLEAEGRRVRHVINVTDLEDKIDQRAASLGLSSRALARAEERTFFRDLDALGNLRPRFRPRASEFVPEMIRLGQRLERTGRVRRVGSEWRYEAPDRPEGENFPSGSDLARHAVEEPGHPFGAPSETDRTFVVWKLLAPPLAGWPSPWGRGAPGWHLQCFAMASRLLGVPVDLHGGGRDLVFPHHFAENEISLALRRTPFARVFLHTGLVLENGSKMSKSGGNLIPLADALERLGRDPLRWYLLGRPYADRFPWEESAADRAKEELALVRSTLSSWLRSDGGRHGSARTSRLLARVRASLGDRLRADRAVGELRSFAAEVGTAGGGVPRGERPAVRSALSGIEQRLGIRLA